MPSRMRRFSVSYTAPALNVALSPAISQAALDIALDAASAAIFSSYEISWGSTVPPSVAAALAVELANRESRSSWRDFLLGLKARGLHGVEFVISQRGSLTDRRIRKS